MVQHDSIHHARFASYNGLGNLDIKQTLLESSGDNAPKEGNGEKKKLGTDATDNMSLKCHGLDLFYLDRYYVSLIDTSSKLNFIVLERKHRGRHQSSRFSIFHRMSLFSNINTILICRINVLFNDDYIIFIDGTQDFNYSWIIPTKYLEFYYFANLKYWFCCFKFIYFLCVWSIVTTMNIYDNRKIQ